MSAKGFKHVTAAPGDNRDVEQSTNTPSADLRRDPAIALAAAAAVAPTLPPTLIEQNSPVDPVAQLNLKVRESLIDQLARAASQEGTTQKVIVCRALAAVGYQVHPDDLADRGNHRRRRS